MMSELGRETVSAYAAAKGGLKMLTKNICSEYGQYNIQCNGLGPGYIETPQTAPLREIQPDGSRHPFDQFICAKTPANRWLKPEELLRMLESIYIKVKIRITDFKRERNYIMIVLGMILAVVVAAVAELGAIANKKNFA